MILILAEGGRGAGGGGGGIRRQSLEHLNQQNDVQFPCKKNPSVIFFTKENYFISISHFYMKLLNCFFFFYVFLKV